MSIFIKKACLDCEGKGTIECDNCNGTGEHYCWECGTDHECGWCEGEGEYDCKECNGKGYTVIEVDDLDSKSAECFLCGREAVCLRDDGELLCSMCEAQWVFNKQQYAEKS